MRGLKRTATQPVAAGAAMALSFWLIPLVLEFLALSCSLAAADVAVCMSGAIRSLPRPEVYGSIKRHLLENIGGDARGDLFMYLEREDAAWSGDHIHRLNAGWDSGAGRASSSSSSSSGDLDEAIAALTPVSVQFHHRNTTPARANNCTYPSDRWRPPLEKMHACFFRMVLPHETTRGYPYEWVVRTRPDLGLFLPLPRAETFDPTFIYASSAYWPLADQFSLVPRRLANVYFNAVRSVYVCVAAGSAEQRRWLRDGAGGPEQLLWMHLHAYAAPVRYYSFPHVIVREAPAEAAERAGTSEGQQEEEEEEGGGGDGGGGGGGGVCPSLWNHLGTLCVVAHELGRSPWQGPSGARDCSFALFTAASHLCRIRFPPLPSRDNAEAAGDDKGGSAAATADALVASIRELKERTPPTTTNPGEEVKAEGEVVEDPSVVDAVHPMILTATGGEYRAGQVASAVVLRGRRVMALMEDALTCAVVEFQLLLAEELAILSRKRPTACMNQTAGVCLNRTTKAGTGRLAGRRCEGGFSSGLVHDAQLEIARSTVAQVTCEGKECEVDSEDYNELIAALRHHTVRLLEKH